MDTPAIIFSKANVAVIINVASGTADASSEQKMRTLLDEAGIEHPDVWVADVSSIEASFKEAFASDPDVLIVLGGDGTIRIAVESCTSTRPLLIPLPGGTMNLLPKALYGEVGWEEALRATLHAPRIKSISGGKIGTKQFCIAAVAGAAVLWTKAREAVREGNLGGAVDESVHAVEKMFAEEVTYSFEDGKEAQSNALAIVCPLISEVLEDTEKSFEAAVIDVENAAGVLSLASNAAFGKWRDDGQVTIVKTHQVHLSAPEDVPIILDGESMDFGKDFSIEFVPESFRVLVPKGK